MSKKLPEIERTPGGGLPRMTAAQRRRANALIRKTCCNYENGNCLLLDDREECVCPQTISYSVVSLGGAAAGQGAGIGDFTQRQREAMCRMRGNFRPSLQPDEIL